MIPDPVLLEASGLCLNVLFLIFIHKQQTEIHMQKKKFL